MTINGPGSNRITVSGGNSTRAFEVIGTTHLGMTGLTTANGFALSAAAGKGDVYEHKIYLWEVPWEKETGRPEADE